MNLSFGGVAAMDYHVCVLTLETVDSIRSYADTTRKSLNVLSDGGALDRRQSVCVLNHVDSQAFEGLGLWRGLCRNLTAFSQQTYPEMFLPLQVSGARLVR